MCPSRLPLKGHLAGFVEAVDFINKQNGLAFFPCFSITARTSFTPESIALSWWTEVHLLGDKRASEVFPLPVAPKNHGRNIARFNHFAHTFPSPTDVAGQQFGYGLGGGVRVMEQARFSVYSLKITVEQPVSHVFGQRNVKYLELWLMIYECWF